MDKIADNFHNELLNARRDREIGCVDGKAERGAVQENGRNPDIVSTHSHNTMQHNRNGGMSGKDCHRRYHVNAERILGKKWEKSTTLANTTLPGKNYYPPLADKSLNILNIPFPCYAWGHRFCPPTHG
ncbi:MULTISPECIES: hypothetical protein [Bacteroidales]|uniref:hypothetical protein n=1 Tax=Bacteroidales TaxID=171549 RepID=UPI00137142E6|nr:MULTISPECIES: hypothetical protein [Bacteroidales]NBH92072.1 hypothetical protein [Muribaculaceae bacterium S4]NBI20473.1 hypothetical protein [Muribaculaceae bacterium Z1]